MKLASVLLVVAAVVALACWWLRAPSAPASAAEPGRRAGAIASDARELDLPAVAADDDLVESVAPSAPPVDERVAVASTYEPAAGATRIAVRVVGDLDGAPVEGKRVFAYPSEGARGAANVERSVARLGEAPLTDFDGRAWFEVEPGDYTVGLLWQKTEPEIAEVLALRAGELRELEFVAHVDREYAMCVLLVDDGSGAAITDERAKIDVGPHYSARLVGEVALAPDGTRAFRVRAGKEATAGATAPGYARAAFAIQEGHETPELALEVRLLREATLEVFVYRNGRTVAGAQVSVATTGPGGPLSIELDRATLREVHVNRRQVHATDEIGRVEIRGLPSRTLLNVSASDLSRSGWSKEQSVLLEPGERRRVEVHLDPVVLETARDDEP